MRNSNKVITKNLRKIRKIRQFTQEQLGRAMGLSAAAIGNYERGEIKKSDLHDQFKF